MAIKKSSDVELLWGSVAIEDVESNGVSLSTAEVGTTTYDSGGFASSLPGTKSGTYDVSYNCDYVATEGFSQMLADWIAGTIQAALLTSQDSGDVTIGGSAWVKDLSWTGSLDQPGKVTATLNITGAITQGTVV